MEELNKKEGKEKNKFNIECWHCKNFWDCEGKPKGIDFCVHFSWRQDRHRGGT